MKEYIDVEKLKQQDFQDYSNTDVARAISECPRLALLDLSELRKTIRSLHNDWLEKEYEHETNLPLSEYLAQEILKQFDVVKNKGG